MCVKELWLKVVSHCTWNKMFFARPFLSFCSIIGKHKAAFRIWFKRGGGGERSFNGVPIAQHTSISRGGGGSRCMLSQDF